MLKANDSLVLVIDIQEKLTKMLGESDVSKNAQIVTKAASILNIPTIITEQYPKGLGETLEAIKDASSNAKYFEKTSFSALKSEEILSEIKNSGKKQVVLFGIEAHICVLQTAIELTSCGFEVYLLPDCSGSRKNIDFELSIKYMQNEGVKVISKEMALFMWLEGSAHPNFKEVQALIKNA